VQHFVRQLMGTALGRITPILLCAHLSIARVNSFAPTVSPKPAAGGVKAETLLALVRALPTRHVLLEAAQLTQRLVQPLQVALSIDRVKSVPIMAAASGATAAKVVLLTAVCRAPIRIVALSVETFPTAQAVRLVIAARLALPRLGAAGALEVCLDACSCRPATV